MFASVDGEGYIDIWTLDNIEEPKIHFKAEGLEYNFRLN